MRFLKGGDVLGKRPTIFDLGDVRVIRFNSMNLAIERYENVFIPKEKKKEKRWVFYGYQTTLFQALQTIVKKELLIDDQQINSVGDYVKQVEESNNKILTTLKEID